MHVLDKLHNVGTTTSTLRTAAAKTSQTLRTQPWSKIISSEANQAAKRHCGKSILGVSADEAGPSDPGSAGLEKQSAELSSGNEGPSAHYMSPDGKIRKAAGLRPKPARKIKPTRIKQTVRKSTSPKWPAITKVTGIARTEPDQGKLDLSCLNNTCLEDLLQCPIR